MDKKIAVIYSSQYGATQEIAEKMGEVLRDAGLQADVFPIKSIMDLSPYQAVILGSGVYIGQWNKEADVFLKSNEKALTDRQVWLFSSGPTGEGDPVELLNGWRLPAKLQPVADRIQPRDVAVFHGYINPNKVHPVQKWVIKNLLKKPFGDYRDWNAIANWAGRIASDLLDGRSEQ